MTHYLLVMPGRKAVYFQQCLDGGMIGGDFNISQDLHGQLPWEWKEFNERFIPVYLEACPGASKITAGLACGALWTIAKWLQKGDIVLMPNGNRQYAVGTIESDYIYSPETEKLQHQRRVRWLPDFLEKDNISKDLQRSLRSNGMVSNVSRYESELSRLIKELKNEPEAIPRDVEDAECFAMEKHLEDFLIANWSHTALGRDYDIFSNEDGEPIGRQLMTETGPLDILAISKDKKNLLVIELKRGRASDVVVGQILRYMGCVKEKYAEEGQTVSGAIIALEDDIKLRKALSVISNVSFYRYKISFKLEEQVEGCV